MKALFSTSAEHRTEKVQKGDMSTHATKRTNTIAWNHHRATNIRCNDGVRATSPLRREQWREIGGVANPR
jgi:hypothetical protein